MYLKVVCCICGACWNYYGMKSYPSTASTGTDCQGCICPSCGALGYITNMSDSCQTLLSLAMSKRKE